MHMFNIPHFVKLWGKWSSVKEVIIRKFTLKARKEQLFKTIVMATQEDKAPANTDCGQQKKMLQTELNS